jgi:hypothetical protein
MAMTFEMIFHMQLHKGMGLNFSKVVGLSSLGIKASKVVSKDPNIFH